HSWSQSNMAAPQQTGPILPNYRIPKLFGNLNILFASQILVCGLCLSVSALSLPMVNRAMSQIKEQTEKQFDARKKAELEELEERAAKATSDADKIDVAASRKEIETRPRPSVQGMDFTQMGMLDPSYIAFSWTEVLSGITLNVLLLASGIGLL